MRGPFLTIVLACVCLLPARVRAQSPEEKPLPLQQRILLDRLKAALGLDEDQQARIRALLRTEGERTRNGIRELLTEDQRGAYDAMEERTGLAGPGRIRFGGPGEGGPGMSFAGFGGGGPLGLTVRGLKKELGVTEEEAAALEAIFKGYREERGKAMGELMREMDVDAMGRLAEITKELDDKTLAKAREALSPERREGFDALVEKKRKKATSSVVRVFGPGGEEMDPGSLEGLGDLGKALQDGLKGLGKTLGGLKTGEGDGLPGLEEIAAHLDLEGMEGEILREKIQNVLDAEKDLRAFVKRERGTLKQIMEGGGTAQDWREGLEEYRKARVGKEERVRERKEDLRSLLTWDQEGKLVALGVLD